MHIPDALALALLDIEERDLRAAAGPASWAHGLTAWKTGKVIELLVDDSGTLIGRVKDSGLAYKTWIAPSDIGLDMTCACPVGRNCYHCIATVLAAKDEVEATARPHALWRQRLTALVGEESGAGESLALLVDAHDPADPIWITPLRRGSKVAWTTKRASWPDLVSTQWQSVTDGLNPAHVALIREGYALSRESAAWQSRNDVSLESLSSEAAGWLQRLKRAGVLLLAGLDPLTPLDLDPSTWDLGLDVRLVDEGLSLAPIARNGADLVVDPRISARTRLLVLDGGTRLARLQGAPLLDAMPEGRIIIPTEDRAEFVSTFIPRLKRHYALVTSDASVDLDEEAPARLVATVRPDGDEALVVRWWAEFDYEGGASRVPLASARDMAAVADLIERVDARGQSYAPAGMWGQGLRTFRVPAWRAPDFLERVVASVVDDRLEWDVADEVVAIKVENDRMEIEAGLVESTTDWFDLDVKILLAGTRVPLSEVALALAVGRDYLNVEGTWVRLEGERVDRLRALLDEARLVADSDTARLAPVHLGLWEKIVDLVDISRAAQSWRSRVRALDAVEDVLAPSPRCTATLRPYQEEGRRWLAARARTGLGGVLADDMGLGKTLELLSLIVSLLDAPGDEGAMTGEGPSSPVLVVAPTSVLSTWKSEAARFVPGLRVAVVSETAKRRGSDLDELRASHDVIVTSYTILRLEADEWADAPYRGLIIDEAQAAKNPRTAIHKALMRIDADWTFAVTGTPVENSLTDLWAILALCTPGLLPAWQAFNDKIRRPIENGADPHALDRLHHLVAPFLLRRTKEDVAPDLPDKIESIVSIELGAEHRRIYDQYLMRERARVLRLIDEGGRAKVDVLAAITRLRRLALDPALAEDEYEHVGSAKIEYLADQLDQIVPTGHKVLVFSQFTSFLARIRAAVERRGIGVVELDGSTRSRSDVIDRFRSGQAPVFLISLKAGGTGLTLTEADYVFVMDPWWNPAAEAQAVDRAHRIGQDKKVNVYRLVAADTIEDKVVALQDRKRELVDTVIAGAGTGAFLDAQTLRDLLA